MKGIIGTTKALKSNKKQTPIWIKTDYLIQLPYSWLFNEHVQEYLWIYLNYMLLFVEITWWYISTFIRCLTMDNNLNTFYEWNVGHILHNQLKFRKKRKVLADLIQSNVYARVWSILWSCIYISLSAFFLNKAGLIFVSH